MGIPELPRPDSSRDSVSRVNDKGQQQQTEIPNEVVKSLQSFTPSSGSTPADAQSLINAGKGITPQAATAETVNLASKGNTLIQGLGRIGAGIASVPFLLLSKATAFTFCLTTGGVAGLSIPTMAAANLVTKVYKKLDDDIDTKINNVQKKLSYTNKELEQTKRNIQELQVDEGSNGKFEDGGYKLKREIQEQGRLERIISGLGKELEKLENKATKGKSIDEKIESLQEEINKQQGLVDAKKNEIKELRNQLKEFHEMKNVQGDLKQLVTTRKSEKKALIGRISTLKNRIVKLEEKRTETKISNLEGKKIDWKTHKGRITGLHQAGVAGSSPVAALGENLLAHALNINTVDVEEFNSKVDKLFSLAGSGVGLAVGTVPAGVGVGATAAAAGAAASVASVFILLIVLAGSAGKGAH